MGVNLRVIPRLDIKGPNLVKGINFEGLRVLGKPEDFARLYYEQGADELIYMDAVASLYGRNNLPDIIEKTARSIFIPLTVGGGLRSVEDIRDVLRAGADKVALNTAVVANPALISEAASAFGSSTVVVALEVVPVGDGKWQCRTDFGREETGLDALEWAVEAERLGAGELLVTSIDREGTGRGFDLELIRTITEAVSIPVVAAGGAGTVDHVLDAAARAHADAVCLASLLHYEAFKRFTYGSGDFSGEGNVNFRKRGGGPPMASFKAASLPEVKKHLAAHGVQCREVAS